ncbi:MAG: hypothetical protein CL672_05020 [Balneola sp.]|nr:hypothetical protein [Balneola sp.]|tara:strand:- start:1444 stop:3099 length:1656 start_codon:yes stop_codon:yes gene_type:complete
MQSIDRTEFNLVSEDSFLEISQKPDPNRPILVYDVWNVNTYDYSIKIQTNRYLQRYRPSLISTFFGFLGASAAYLTADLLSTKSTDQYMLYGIGMLSLITGLSGDRSLDEATSTGEQRLLKQTGVIQLSDTLRATKEPNTSPSYTIYNDLEAIAIRNNVKFDKNNYHINLLEDINPTNFLVQENQSIRIELDFNDSLYIQVVPVEDIFERFVVVESEVTALRQNPDNTNNSILTDLVKGSELLLLGDLDNWYVVRYGITETYISKNDTKLIWRPTDYIDELSIITIPNMPFGNVDVERGIPVRLTENNQAVAFVLSNEFYGDSFPTKKYAERDSKLIEEYLVNSLGLGFVGIRTSINASRIEQFRFTWDEFLKQNHENKKQFILYVNGYVTIDNKENIIYLLGDQASYTWQNNSISLTDLLLDIIEAGFIELFIVGDFSFSLENQESTISRAKYYDAFYALNSTLLSNRNINFGLLFSSDGRSDSQLYTKQAIAQKYHSIFSYYIADAIKKGNYNTSQLINYVQRNVDYTARRLHDTPQNIVFFGNSNIEF